MGVQKKPNRSGGMLQPVPNPDAKTIYKKNKYPKRLSDLSICICQANMYVKIGSAIFILRKKCLAEFVIRSVGLKVLVARFDKGCFALVVAFFALA